MRTQQTKLRKSVIASDVRDANLTTKKAKQKAINEDSSYKRWGFKKKQCDETVAGFIIDKRGVEECPCCYCTPCVTDETNRQLWWIAEAKEPHRLNTKLRTDAYKKFWTI